MTSLCNAGGYASTGLLLLLGDLLATVVDTTVKSLCYVVDVCTGSGKNTVRNKAAWHQQRYSVVPVYAKEPSTGTGFGEIDLEATLAKSNFPIQPAALIEKAKAVLSSEFGTAGGSDGSCLAEDFQFVAPIVGPLGKAEFRKAFGSFKIRDAIPDLADNSWFHVDPLEPNRVWFFSRPTGTHTGPLNFGGTVLPATGRKIASCPQAQSMLFDEQGKCYTLTVGYCMDKRIGNTEGLGGVFGILKAVGKALPFPEGQRLYNPSLRFEAFERFAKAAECFGLGPAAQR